MKHKINTKIIKYAASFLLGGGLFATYILTRDFPVSEAAENYRMISDAATIPGLLFLMVGCLVWAASLGATDGIAFALRKAIRALLPAGRLQDDETYADYVEKRREKYAKAKGYGFLFITGGVFLLVAVVFVALFYSAS